MLESESPLDERLNNDTALRYALQRDVAGELAEQLIRLRRYRGLSQEALADAIGASQPTIARHESARSNMTCKSLEVLLQGLKGVLRVDLVPEEHDYLLREIPRWWNVLLAVSSSSSQEACYQFKFQAARPLCQVFGAESEMPSALSDGGNTVLAEAWRGLPSEVRAHA